MSFMKPQVVESTWLFIESTKGVCFVIDKDIVGETYTHKDLLDFIEGEVFEVTELYGCCARLSASGYLDCTDWCGPYDTKERAFKELTEIYDLTVED